MVQQLLMILGGILALISAGTLSYSYLSQTMGPREVPVSTTTNSIPSVAKKVATTTPVKTVQKSVANTTPKATPVTSTNVVPETVAVKQAVVAPGPLRAEALPVSAPASKDLSLHGVIQYTNIARAENGSLPPLVENSTLDLDAQIKLNDMFAKQYFEHVSPSGIGPADLAQAVGYAYVVVGENLALGDFGGDQGVVTAWMNSPGHRANILNAHYQEIGVAVGKGMYEGHNTWLAVQSFGMPLSACPAINAALKVTIDANNTTIASYKAQLEAKKAQIDATSTSDPSYNTFVNEFNALIPEYNNLIEVNRANVASYNLGVQTFNACIAAAAVH